MEQIPDAPWIRDAEQNGMPSDEPVKCPICGEECETLYADEDDSIIGCDKCIHTVDPWDWQEEQRLSEIDWFAEHRTEDGW